MSGRINLDNMSDGFKSYIQGLDSQLNHIENKIPVSVTDFGAKGDGKSDDTLAIQNAIEFVKSGGGIVLFPSGKYMISNTITLYKNVKLQGYDKNTTIIKLRENSNCDIIKTYKFDYYTGKNIIDDDTPSGFSITGLTIDGDYKNNTSGYGLRIYGKKFDIDLNIFRCAEVGFYSEFGTNYIHQGEDIPDSNISLSILETGQEGFVFKGPSDILIKQLFCGWNGKKKSESILYSGQKTHSVVIDGTVEIQFLHSFENENGYGVRFVNNHRVKCDRILVDYTNGGVLFDNACGVQIALCDVHKLRPQSINPYVYVGKINNVNISNLEIKKTPDDGDVTGLHIKGDNFSVGTGIITGNSSGNTSGHGVIIDGSHCNIGYLDIRNLENRGESKYFALITNETAYRQRNHVNINVYKCHNIWKNANLGGFNIYNINGIYNSNEGQIGFEGSKPQSFRETWNVHLLDSHTNTYTILKETIFRNRIIRLDIDTEQTITIPHRLMFAPNLQDISFNLINSDNITDFEVGYMFVSNVTDNEIILKVKMSKVSSTLNSYISLSVKAEIL